MEDSFQCYFCKSEFSDKEGFFQHVKEHLQKCQSLNNTLLVSGPLLEKQDFPRDERVRGKLQKLKVLRKRRKKVHVKAKDIKSSVEKEDSSGISNDEEKSSELSDEDCLGGSESSDSDSDAMETSFWSDQKNKKNKPSPLSLAKSRLSLAEKQLDSNETEELMCLTCLKKFSNCQNLRRHDF